MHGGNNKSMIPLSIKIRAGEFFVIDDFFNERNITFSIDAEFYECEKIQTHLLIKPLQNGTCKELVEIIIQDSDVIKYQKSMVETISKIIWTENSKKRDSLVSRVKQHLKKVIKDNEIIWLHKDYGIVCEGKIFIDMERIEQQVSEKKDGDGYDYNRFNLKNYVKYFKNLGLFVGVDKINKVITLKDVIHGEFKLSNIDRKAINSIYKLSWGCHRWLIDLNTVYTGVDSEKYIIIPPISSFVGIIDDNLLEKGWFAHENNGFIEEKSIYFFSSVGGGYRLYKEIVNFVNKNIYDLNLDCIELELVINNLVNKDYKNYNDLKYKKLSINNKTIFIVEQ